LVKKQGKSWSKLCWHFLTVLEPAREKTIPSGIMNSWGRKVNNSLVKCSDWYSSCACAKYVTRGLLLGLTLLWNFVDCEYIRTCESLIRLNHFWLTLKYYSYVCLEILRLSTLYLIEVANRRAWDTNPESLVYEVWALTTQPWRSAYWSKMWNPQWVKSLLYSFLIYR